MGGQGRVVLAARRPELQAQPTTLCCCLVTVGPPHGVNPVAGGRHSGDLSRALARVWRPLFLLHQLRQVPEGAKGEPWAGDLPSPDTGLRVSREVALPVSGALCSQADLELAVVPAALLSSQASLGPTGWDHLQGPFQLQPLETVALDTEPHSLDGREAGQEGAGLVQAPDLTWPGCPLGCELRQALCPHVSCCPRAHVGSWPGLGGWGLYGVGVREVLGLGVLQQEQRSLGAGVQVGAGSRWPPAWDERRGTGGACGPSPAPLPSSMNTWDTATVSGPPRGPVLAQAWDRPAGEEEAGAGSLFPAGPTWASCPPPPAARHSPGAAHSRHEGPRAGSGLSQARGSQRPRPPEVLSLLSVLSTRVPHHHPCRRAGLGSPPGFSSRSPTRRVCQPSPQKVGHSSRSFWGHMRTGHLGPGWAWQGPNSPRPLLCPLEWRHPLA